MAGGSVYKRDEDLWRGVSVLIYSAASLRKGRMAFGRRDSTINRYAIAPLYKNDTMIIRYLMNPSASSGFYGRNRQDYPTGPPILVALYNSDDAIYSRLQSISCSLIK